MTPEQIKKLKFKKEADFCLHVMHRVHHELKRRHPRTNYQIIPEVPRGWHNNHADILIIDRNRKYMVVLEFKLSGWKKLVKQCRSIPLGAFGVVNTDTPDFTSPEFRNTPWARAPICSYTDDESGINNLMCLLSKRYRWSPAFTHCEGTIYWFAYENTQSSLLGGLQHGERESFYQVYRRAIRNLVAHYPCLDFEMVFKILGYYSESTARKHYKSDG